MTQGDTSQSHFLAAYSSVGVKSQNHVPGAGADGESQENADLTDIDVSRRVVQWQVWFQPKSSVV